MLRSIRIIVELGLVVLLLSLGWEKPFKSRFDSVAHVQGGASPSAPLFDSEAHQPQVAAAPPAPPAASPHGAWMWDKIASPRSIADRTIVSTTSSARPVPIITMTTPRK